MNTRLPILWFCEYWHRCAVKGVNTKMDGCQVQVSVSTLSQRGSTPCFFLFLWSVPLVSWLWRRPFHSCCPLYRLLIWHLNPFWCSSVHALELNAKSSHSSSRSYKIWLGPVSSLTLPLPLSPSNHSSSAPLDSLQFLDHASQAPSLGSLLLLSLCLECSSPLSAWLNSSLPSRPCSVFVCSKGPTQATLFYIAKCTHLFHPHPYSRSPLPWPKSSLCYTT